MMAMYSSEMRPRLSEVDLRYLKVPGHGPNAYAQGQPAVGENINGGRVLEHLEGGAEWCEGHGGAEPDILCFPSGGGEEDEGVEVGEGHVVRDPEVVVAEVIGHLGEFKGLGAFFGREEEGAELEVTH